jgi:hypothetical protein
LGNCDFSRTNFEPPGENSDGLGGPGLSSGFPIRYRAADIFCPPLKSPGRESTHSECIEESRPSIRAAYRKGDKGQRCATTQCTARQSLVAVDALTGRAALLKGINESPELACHAFVCHASKEGVVHNPIIRVAAVEKEKAGELTPLHAKAPTAYLG